MKKFFFFFGKREREKIRYRKNVQHIKKIWLIEWSCKSNKGEISWTFWEMIFFILFTFVRGKDNQPATSYVSDESQQSKILMIDIWNIILLKGMILTQEEIFITISIKINDPFRERHAIEGENEKKWKAFQMLKMLESEKWKGKVSKNRSCEQHHVWMTAWDA